MESVTRNNPLKLLTTVAIRQPVPEGTYSPEPSVKIVYPAK